MFLDIILDNITDKESKKLKNVYDDGSHHHKRYSRNRRGTTQVQGKNIISYRN